MGIVQQVTREHDIYLANSLNSLRIEGQKTISIELAQQFDWEVPDFIIIPGGNLGNVSALGRGFMMMQQLGLIDRLPRLVCAQAERANPLYRSYLSGFKTYEPVVAQQTLATAIQIGNPVSIDRAIKTLQRFDGIVEQATEDELANASARADLTGMYSCPHTGVALAVLFKLVERGVIAGRDRVVVLSTAHGLKFSDFKMAYHDKRLEGIASWQPNPPVLLPASYDAVMDAIDARQKAMA
jgi:threonine synthase